MKGELMKYMLTLSQKYSRIELTTGQRRDEMDNAHILKHVDHTLLTPSSSWSDIRTLCQEAIHHQTAAVCIPPNYVGQIRKTFSDPLTICTVIGFPLGYQTTEVKVFEAEQAIRSGADEIDMVINLTDVKNKAYEKVLGEVAALRKAVGDKVLKVIIETCYLTEDEKIKMCTIITEAGADYIKTSTGFGTEGARLEDIYLFKKHIGPRVKIKAAGGIRSQEDLVAFIEAGCDRIGTSSAVSLLTKGETTGY